MDMYSSFKKSCPGHAITTSVTGLAQLPYLYFIVAFDIGHCLPLCLHKLLLVALNLLEMV